MPLTPGYGETPLPEDELAALLPHVVEVLDKPIRRADVYDLEQAVQEQVSEDLLIAAFAGSLRLDDLMSDYFLRDLHTRLYGDIWAWAGRWRDREVNIGVAPEQIAVELRNSLDNIRYRWEHTDDWTPRELGVVPMPKMCASIRLPTETVERQDFSPTWCISAPKIRRSTSTTGMSTRSATSICSGASMSAAMCANLRPLLACNPLTREQRSSPTPWNRPRAFGSSPPPLEAVHAPTVSLMYEIQGPNRVVSPTLGSLHRQAERSRWSTFALTAAISCPTSIDCPDCDDKETQSRAAPPRPL